MSPDEEPIRAFFRGDDHPAPPRSNARRDEAETPGPDAVPLDQIEKEFDALERAFDAAPDKAPFLARIRAVRRAIGNRRSRVGSLFARLQRIETAAATVIGDRKTRKTDLCLLAERLGDSTDWKAAGDRLEELKATWKNVGWAGDAEEYLWQRFRAANEAFHERRIAHFASGQEDREQNLRAKQALVAEAEHLAGSAELGVRDAVARMKELQAEWRQIGSAPRERAEELGARFQAAGDRVFEKSRAGWLEKQRLALAAQHADARDLRASIAHDQSLIDGWQRTIDDLLPGGQRDEIEWALRGKIQDVARKLRGKRARLAELERALRDAGPGP